MITLLLALALAKPPEPLEEVLPQTQLIVDAVVADATSVPSSDRLPAQKLTLKVNRVVRGKLAMNAKGDTTIVVVKPAGAYTVKAGVKGPWLLHVDEKTGEMTVLGRYGPDTWTFEKIDQKLKELDPPHLR